MAQIRENDLFPVASPSSEPEVLIDGKIVSSKEPYSATAPSAKFGSLVTGSGTFASVSQQFNLLNYNFETGSVVAGIDYRIDSQTVIGAFASYGRTAARFSLGDRLYGNSADWGMYGLGKRRLLSRCYRWWRR